MYWKIVFYHQPSGETSIGVGPFTSAKKRDDFHEYWKKELMTPKQVRGYYHKVRFTACKTLDAGELAMAPKGFNGIPDDFRFAIAK